MSGRIRSRVTDLSKNVIVHGPRGVTVHPPPPPGSSMSGIILFRGPTDQ